MIDRSSVCRAVILGSLAALLCGCVPIPYVIPPLGNTAESRHNLGERARSFIVQGQTTREEVLYALGEPDTGDDQWFSYVSASRQGGVGTLLVPAFGSGPIPDAHTQRVLFRRLIVQFDADGRVSHFENQSKTCSIGYLDDDMFNHQGVSVNSFYRCLPAPTLGVPVSEAKTPANQVQPIGTGRYMITARGSGGLDAGKEMTQATRDANAFCANQSKQMALQNTDKTGNTIFGENVTLTFTCE
jgi:hypothetical protein